MTADPLSPTVFHEPWWLNIVSGGGWEEARVSSLGRVVGRFPYVVEPLWPGHSLCGMPQATHFLGPAIDDGTGAACNRSLKRAQITRDLLEQMPRTTGFYQKCSRDVTDTLIFQELGFHSGVQFTYEIAPAAEKTLWRAMRDKTRNVIRRAEEIHPVDLCCDPLEFASVYDRNVASRNMRSYYDKALLVRLCTAAIARGQGRISVVRHASGDIAAGIFCVSDAVSTYYLLSTRDAAANNGAVSLLLWHAIKASAEKGLIFDFDGVGLNGSRLFFTGFGGSVHPRYIVSRYTLSHRIAGRLSHPFRRGEAATIY